MPVPPKGSRPIVVSFEGESNLPSVSSPYGEERPTNVLRVLLNGVPPEPSRPTSASTCAIALNPYSSSRSPRTRMYEELLLARVRLWTGAVPTPSSARTLFTSPQARPWMRIWLFGPSAKVPLGFLGASAGGGAGAVWG